MKKYIILHHTATARDTTTFEAVNNYHKEKWNFKSSLGYYIGYHYFINAAGKVYQGRADDEPGAHCYQENKNYDSIGVCMAGEFDKEYPSQAQLDSLKKLLKDLMAKHNIPFENLKFHRDYAPKTCPGTNIKNDFFTNLLKDSNNSNHPANAGQEDMMKLIQKTGSNEIYAVDKFNRRHQIVNWDTFQRGLAMGLWDSNIQKLPDLNSYQPGNLIVLTMDN